jgi:hypothetical protein
VRRRRARETRSDLTAERREVAEMDRTERILALRIALLVVVLAVYVALQILVL